jgi:hypothetical protein
MIQDIAAKNSSLLAADQKLSSEGLVEEKEICPNPFSKTLIAIKTDQFVRAGALNAKSVDG